jgi:coproporphyrinogen III oxidase-like Fe-S oxidoreductase
MLPKLGSCLMRRPTPAEPLRVLLLCKTLIPRSSGAWKNATAPWALGAFSLKSYVATRGALWERVEIAIKSYARDENNELILQEIIEHGPDLVGFTCQPWNHAEQIKLSRLIRRLLPGVVVLHGGPMVLHRDRYLSQLGPDAVTIAVEGEAEESFAELLSHFVFGEPELAAISGLGFFDEASRPVVTAERSNPDVSKLPPLSGAGDLAALGSYMLYETSRGCPFRCSFCNWGSQKARLRSRDRAVIEQDLKAILAQPRVTDLWLTDAGLDISVDHVLFLADVIRRHKRHPVNVSGYFFLLHADLSYVEKLVGAFDTLQLGLQTANERVLSEIGRKPLDLARFDRILDAVLPHFPDLRVDLLYGLPGIGPKELRQSVRFLLDKGIWLINLYRLIAIPGTEMAENRERYGLVADEEFPYNVYASDGCSIRDLLEMQQFKVNMDTLRGLFAGGAHARAKSAGLDLIEFADRLHTLIPRFNHRTDFGLEMDRKLEPELIDALYDAAARFAGSTSQQVELAELLERAYGPRRTAPELQRPSGALRGLTRALSRGLGGFAEPRSLRSVVPRWQAFIARAENLEQLGVHVHVPFCRTICTYCDCATEALDEPAQVERYLDYLEQEMAFISPIFSGVELERLYIGGGTPNILGAAQLDRMLRMVFESHRFRAGAVLCLESDPRQVTRDKLEVARRHGINRLSFGVQSTDPAVLKRANRVGQTPEMVETAVRASHALGFPELNLDYVYGLQGEALARFVDGVLWGIQLSPATVCIQLLNDSDYAAPYSDAAHRADVAAGFRELEARLAERLAKVDGYALRRRPDTLILVKHDLWRPWDGHLEYYSARDHTLRSTIGYGRHAQSTLYGDLHYQNQDRTARFDPGAPIYAARSSAPELECLADLIAELEYQGTIDLECLERRHAKQVVESLETELGQIERAGRLERRGRKLVDRGVSEADVQGLVEALRGPSVSVDEAIELAHVLVTEADRTWRIRIEPVRESMRYFRVLAGYGIFYQSEPGVALRGARTEKIMQAVAGQLERLLAEGVPPELLAERVAKFLERRIGGIGIHARAVAPRRRRTRLTVIAPG